MTYRDAGRKNTFRPMNRIMKYSILFPFLFAIMAALVCADSSALTADVKHDKGADIGLQGEIISIETIVVSPEKFFGEEIRVRGIVAGVTPDTNHFILSGSSGCTVCRSPSRDILTVIYAGTLPKLREIVTVSGTLGKEGHNKILLNATMVQSK